MFGIGVRAERTRCTRQLITSHAAHGDVGKQEPYLGMCGEMGQSIGAGGRIEDEIAGIPEPGDCDPAHTRIIFHNEDGLAAPRQRFFAASSGLPPETASST